MRQVTAVRLEERSPDADAAQIVSRFSPIQGLEGAAGERVAVGVQAARGERNQCVAHADSSSSDCIFEINDANHRADDIGFTRPVHAGHLGRFAAQQHATGGLASAGHARDDGGDPFRLEAASSHVIHEKQWFRALRQYIVDAVVNDIRTDPIPRLELGGDHRFRAHAIGAGHQHRPLELLQSADLEHPAERADAREDSRVVRGCHRVFHQRDGSRPFGDVDACIGVSVCV